MKTLLVALLLTFPLFSKQHLFEEKPFKVISGEESGLDHPEGIAFTPDGKYVALASFTGDSIKFYEFEGSNIPVFVLEGPETLLSHPHDIAFSPDGEYLAVANRKSHAVTIYKKDDEGIAFNRGPMTTITEGLYGGVGAIAYSPTENILAVGDTYTNRILIYSYSGDTYQKTPICTLSTCWINFVDGLAFSPDGKFLGVTSHGNCRAFFFERMSNTQQLFSARSVHVIERSDALLKYPHSIAFHPTKDFLAISSAGGYQDVNFYEQEVSDQLSYISAPIQSLKIMTDDVRYAIHRRNPQECGAKGIAFSPDGKVLGVCAPSFIGEDSVQFFREK